MSFFRKRRNSQGSIVLTFLILLLLTMVPMTVDRTNGYFDGNIKLQDGQMEVRTPSRGEETVSSSFKTAAWTFPWDPDSWDSVQRWAPILDEISPYWYWSYPNGSVDPTHNETADMDFILLCRETDTDIMPMISNNHDPGVVENISRDPSVQSRHIEQLVNITLRYTFSGIDINYENIRTRDKNVYANFISNLSDALHAKGKRLSVSVFPKISEDENREGPGGYDYARLGEYADQIRVMAYNLHWSTVDRAGPITAEWWVREVLGYAASVIPPHKLMLGIPQFSYDWEVTEAGKTLDVAVNRSFEEIESIRTDHNLERKWNSTSRTPYFEYQDRKGIHHQLHYCDSETLMHEMRMISDLGLRGASIWKIGGEDPLTSFFMEQLRSVDISDLPPYVDIGEDITGMRGTEIPIGPVRAYDIEGTIDHIEWDLDDGNSTSELDPMHIYGRGGFYRAELLLIDDAGNSMTVNKSVKIGPWARMNIKGNREVGEPLDLIGNHSWDPEGIVSYNWDLGDGQTAFHSKPTITHVYSRPGKYEVSLTIINKLGYIDTERIIVTIPDILPPKAESGGDMVVWEDSEFILDGRGSRDNAEIEEYIWNTSWMGILKGPVHSIILDDPGIYNASLTVSDSSGMNDTDELKIEVMDRTPPVIELKGPENAILGDMITLDASNSSDNVGIVNYTWNLGSGEVYLDLENISFPVLEAKTYYVTLGITDQKGNWNSTTVSIEVLDVEKPMSKITIDPEPRPLNETFLGDIVNELELDLGNSFKGAILKGETYIFSSYNSSDDSGLAYYRWYFGDGRTAGGPLVYHEYEMSGYYKGELVVSDIFENRLSIPFEILVIPSWNVTVNEISSFVETYSNRTDHVEEDIPEPKKEDPTLLFVGSSALLLILAFVAVWDIFLVVNRSIKWGTRYSTVNGGDGPEK